MKSAFHVPPQIVRILLLTVGIVGSYVVARYFLTPASFHEYGWFRGNAIMELASRPREFAGKKACSECHVDQAQKLAKFNHKTLSCEDCHGPGAAHAASPDNPALQPTKVVFSSCLRCHEANPSRPKWLKQIVVKDHYTGNQCTDCHPPHSPMQPE